MLTTDWDDEASERRYVRWRDVLPLAEHLFREREPDPMWAQRSWELLEQQGLTRYHNQSSRARVLIRLVALAAFYASWCAVLYVESGLHVDSALGDLELPLRVQRRLCAVPDDVEAVEAVDLCRGIMRDAIFEEEYDNTLAGLLSGYGDSGGLYASLVLASDPDWAGRWPLPVEQYNAAANYYNYDLAAALAWLTQGAPVRE